MTQSELESRLNDLQTQKHEMDVLLNELHTMREGKQALQQSAVTSLGKSCAFDEDNDA